MMTRIVRQENLFVFHHRPLSILEMKSEEHLLGDAATHSNLTPVSIRPPQLGRQIHVPQLNP